MIAAQGKDWLDLSMDWRVLDRALFGRYFEDAEGNRIDPKTMVRCLYCHYDWGATDEFGNRDACPVGECIGGWVPDVKGT